MSRIRHGTVSGYMHRHCRCERCTAAVRDYYRAHRAKLRAQGIPEDVHGTRRGYGYYACRCEACRNYESSYMGMWKAMRKAVAS